MSTTGDITITLWGTVGALGGVAGIVGGVAAWAGYFISSRSLQSQRAQFERELESHRLSLKRQELLFQRELEAADALMGLWRKIWPQYSHPDMDWHDACENTAERLGEAERLLEHYLEKHAVAISDQVREHLESARDAAATEKFFESGPESPPPTSAIAAAEKTLNSLHEARAQIFADLRR